jgi:hypothetical protein
MMRWAEHVARMEEMRIAHTVLIVRPEERTRKTWAQMGE